MTNTTAPDRAARTMPHAYHSTATARTARIAIALLLAATVLWCLYWFVHAWPYWEDDAFIHLEFARSVAAGLGFAFNGHVVSGDTAPFWVLLLVGMHTFLADWMIAGKALTVLGAIVGFAGIYAFARRLAQSLQLPGAPLFPAAMVFLLAVSPFTCYWIFSGMESFAAAGLACFAALAARREAPSTRTFLFGCLLAGIVPLVRPEMIFLTALLAVPLLVQWLRLPQSPSKLPALLTGALLLGSPLALWSLYLLHAFGHLLPNTNAAKRAAPSQSVVSHLLSIYSVGFPLVVCGLCAAVVVFCLRASTVRRRLHTALAEIFQPVRQDSRHLPLAAWIILLWTLINTAFYIANRTYVQTRYILVTAPALTVTVLAIVFAASRRAGRVVYALTLFYSVVVSALVVRPFVRNKGANCQVTRDLAVFIRDHVPPAAPVAVFSIGEIAFVSQHPIVDTGGITRPDAIPYLYAPPEEMLHWAQSQGAQYFVSDKPGPDAVLVFNEPMWRVGWMFHRGAYDLSYPLQLWALTPSAIVTQPAGTPAPVRPE